jgi:DNA-binding MarR family transcriptional regulator
VEPTDSTTQAPSAAAALEAWTAVRALAMEQRGRMLAVSASAELTPPQVFALLALTPGEPAPMSSLAGLLRCDASNVTGLVDRLAARGLVRREAAPHDRRVRHLVLTESGIALRTRIAEQLHAPPPGFAALSAAEALELRDLLRKVAAGGSTPPA